MPEWDQREVQDLESIAVSDSWRGTLPMPEKNRVYLPMRETALGHYSATPAKSRFVYDRDFGLRKRADTDD